MPIASWSQAGILLLSLCNQEAFNICIGSWWVIGVGWKKFRWYCKDVRRKIVVCHEAFTFLLSLFPFIGYLPECNFLLRLEFTTVQSWMVSVDTAPLWLLHDTLRARYCNGLQEIKQGLSYNCIWLLMIALSGSQNSGTIKVICLAPR